MHSTDLVKNNFIFNLLCQLSSLIVPIITLPYLTRTIGAYGLGEYSFAYSVAYYFTVFVKLGLNNYGNRTIAYVKGDRETLSRTFWEIYVSQLGIGIVVVCIYAVYALFFAPNKTLGIIMVLIIFSSIIDVTWCMYGLEKFRVTAIRDIITKVFTMILILSFVKSEDDVWKYALIFSLGMFISQLVVLPVLKGEIVYCKVDKIGVIKHIRPNIVLFIPVIAVSVYRTMDKIMLGIFSTDVELGYYHASENIIRVPMAFVVALGTVMLPRMSNMLSKGSNDDELESVFERSISFAMFFSSAICLGIMTVAKEFVPLFFGEGFEKCVYLFYIILPGSMFEAFANVIRTQYLIPRKKDAIFITSLLIGAAVNLVLNLLLIPRLSSVGAAIGTVAAYATVCIVQAICVFNEANIGHNILNSSPYVISGVAMFLCLKRFSVSVENNLAALMIKIIICGIFYIMILVILMASKRLFRVIME